MAPCDAAEIAGGIAELYEPSAEEAGLSLRFVSSGPLPVTGIRELIGQTIANLCDNAVKYGGAAQGWSEIVVETKRVGANAEISVADRGPGIASADREKAIARFARLEGARSRPGSGLGLSLAAAVARLHGGVLRLEDNAPGLRVVLSLPLALPIGTAK
jgi:signal transduction histidine kinase